MMNCSELIKTLITDPIEVVNSFSGDMAMKTGEKTYFDLDIVQYVDLIGVLYDDTQNLPCTDDFNQWFYGSTMGVNPDKKGVVYLHDWEYFASHYLKNGQVKTYLEVENQVLENVLFGNQK